MSDFQTFIQRTDARRSGNVYRAKADCHNGDAPDTLVISEGDGGRILLDCKKGCDAFTHYRMKYPDINFGPPKENATRAGGANGESTSFPRDADKRWLSSTDSVNKKDERKPGVELSHQEANGPWTYPPNPEGEVLEVHRYKKKSGAKGYAQHHYEDGKLVSGGIKGQAVLYLSDKIPADSKLPILFNEGEKPAHAGVALFGDRCHSVTAPGGAGKVHLCDLSLCYGKKVIIPPDNDPDHQGRKHARQICELLKDKGCDLWILPPPDGAPAKWDMANAFPDGVTPDDYWNSARPAAEVLEEWDVEEWQEPTPLLQILAPEPFPLDCLEHPMHRQLVEALAEESECPVDLAVTQSLPTIAAVIQSKTEWKVNHLERPCIYAVGLASSGDRKSPIERALSRPLNNIFKERLRDYKQAVADGSDEAEIQKARMKQLKRDAAKANDKKESDKIMAMINELKTSETELLPPQPLIATEGTGAGIKKAMMRPGSDETLFLSDSEARVVEILFGGAFDSGGESDTDIITKAYTGDQCVGLRGRDDSVHGVIQSPTLSIGLIVQARMAEKFFLHESSTYKGSLARFLWCWPKSKAGHRTFETPQCPSHLLDWWEGLIRDLHDCTPPVNRYNEKEPFEMGAEPAAMRAWRSFMKEVEPKRDPEHGEFALDGEAMLTWAGKLEGHVIRIAIALHAIQYGSGYVERPVSESTMNNAIRITRYYIAHARRVFLGYGTDRTTQDAQKIFRLMKRNQEDGAIKHRPLMAKAGPRAAGGIRLDSYIRSGRQRETGQNLPFKPLCE
jgi:hypothetical protein